ncbi:MAG TPA: hypothetical protein VHE78_14425 [Gemmatimonadaceae bacterium]|nr:hypothetical protein [Gemmatimonadaceae bacterium]
MFSCLGRLGCLVVLAVIAVAAWFTRDYWYPRVRERFVSTPPAASAAQWEPLSPEGAARGRAAFESLRSKNGPVFVNLGAGDFASFVLDEAVHGMSPDAANAEALARDDHLYLRAQVSVADLGGPKTLGPLSGMLEGKQQLTVRGRVEVLKPGRAQFRVDEVSLNELKLPSALIPRLISRVGVNDRDSTIADDAIPVRIARELADVRVAKGRVTLYKNVP